MAFLDLEVIKRKKVDQKTTMIVSRNLTGDKLFIEFSTNDGKVRLERSFPSKGIGVRDARIFQEKIQSTADLLAYFGITKPNK